MGQAADERRKFERFHICTPVTLEVADRETVITMATRDISAGGAFLLADEPLPTGTHLNAEINIPGDPSVEETGTELQLRVEGRVIRVEPGGMAVCFFSQKIMPAVSTMDN